MIRVNLRRIADERGYNIQNLVDLTGLHRNVIGELYKDRTGGVTWSTLDAICDGLNITLEELIQYVPTNQMTKDDLTHHIERERYAEHKLTLRKQRKAQKTKKLQDDG